MAAKKKTSKQNARSGPRSTPKAKKKQSTAKKTSAKKTTAKRPSVKKVGKKVVAKASAPRTAKKKPKTATASKARPVASKAAKPAKKISTAKRPPPKSGGPRLADKARKAKERAELVADKKKAQKEKERERIAALKQKESDKAKKEKERVRLATQKEKERKDADKEKARLNAQKEKERLEREKEKERLTLEKEKEKERLAAQKEKERLDAEKEKVRLVAQKEKEKEKARLNAQKEKERLEREKEKERLILEKEKEKERLAAQKEKERLEREKEKERERIRKEKEKLEAARKRDEERLRKEKEREAYRKAREAERAKVRSEKEAAKRALEGRVARQARQAQKIAGNARGGSSRVYRPDAIPSQTGTTRDMPGAIRPGGRLPLPHLRIRPSMPPAAIKPPPPVELDARWARIQQRLAHSPESFRREYAESFDMSWIHHDSALEGVVYTFQELRTAIDDNIVVVPDSSLQPVSEEIRRHKAAIDVVRELGNNDVPLSADVLKRLYLILHPEEGDLKSVKYRKEIPQHRLYFHEYAAPDKIAVRIRQALEWFHGPEAEKLRDPIRVASRLHYDLLRTFPFPDDSGKVARMLMNVVLIRAKYPPAILHSTERQRYYDALRGTLPTIVQMVTDSIKNALTNIEKVLDEEDEKLGAESSHN